MRRVVPPVRSTLSLASMARGAVAAAVGGTRARQQLAERIAARVDARQVLLTDSGTTALRLALEAAALAAPGRPIALPSWACYDLVSAAVGARVPVVFYDVDAATLAPSAAALAALHAHRPAACILVHAFGFPVDVEAARRALPNGTFVVEDCAQAWGATFRERPVGAASDAAVFSFGRGKGLTGGRGGALAWRVGAPPLPAWSPAEAARGWRDVATCAAVLTLADPRLYAIPAGIPSLGLGETRYKPPRPGEPMSDAAAATVLASFDAADRDAAQRRAVAAAWKDRLPQLEGWRTPVPIADAAPSWLRFPVLAPDAAGRDRAVLEGRDEGVAAGYPMPLGALAATLGLSWMAAGSLLGGEALAARLVSWPTHQAVTAAGMSRLIGRLA